jgi:hypothetical protein
VTNPQSQQSYSTNHEHEQKYRQKIKGQGDLDQPTEQMVNTLLIGKAF